MNEICNLQEKLLQMTDRKTENLAFQAIEAGDYIKARDLLEPLLLNESEYALTTLGWMHEAGKGFPCDIRLAATYYEQAAQKGYLDAFNSLGRVLWADGKLVEARKAFKEGAELGNLSSMSWIGAMMLSGKGGPVDVENGMLWVTAAAEKGHIVAKGQLLILERQNSKSIFRHAIYHFKRLLLGLWGYREYSTDPYSGKVF
jgi:uncharacterized protein